MIISPSVTSSVCRTLRVPSGSGHSSSSSLDDQEDPRIIIRRRSLPKARSTDFLESQVQLPPIRMSLRRNTVTFSAQGSGSSSGSSQQCCQQSPVSSHSLALDNFIKGRRSSAGVAIMSCSSPQHYPMHHVVHQDVVMRGGGGLARLSLIHI